MSYLHTLPDGTLLLRINVQPRSSSNRLAGVHNDAVKIHLTTPPVEGKANKAVIAFLAKQLHLPKSAVNIKSGLQNRRKQVIITGCDEKHARRILADQNDSSISGS